MTTGALDITILNAQKLKSIALIGKQRPYVVCQVGVQKERSRTSSGKCPNWNETLRFYITHERTLFITIKRKNKLAADNIIGNVEINLEKVLSEGKENITVPVVTAIGDRCFTQIMSEQGVLNLSLSFLKWQMNSKETQ